MFGTGRACHGVIPLCWHRNLCAGEGPSRWNAAHSLAPGQSDLQKHRREVSALAEVLGVTEHERWFRKSRSPGRVRSLSCWPTVPNFNEELQSFQDTLSCHQEQEPLPDYWVHYVQKVPIAWGQELVLQTVLGSWFRRWLAQRNHCLSPQPSFFCSIVQKHLFKCQKVHKCEQHVKYVISHFIFTVLKHCYEGCHVESRNLLQQLFLNIYFFQRKVVIAIGV